MAIFGIIEQQKTLNFHKLRERKTLKKDNPDATPGSLVSRFSRAMDQSKALRIDNKAINFEKKRIPVSVFHDVIPQIGCEEDDKLVKDVQVEDATIDTSIMKQQKSPLPDKYFSRKVSASGAPGIDDFLKQRYKTEDKRERSQSREVNEVKTQNYYMVTLKYNYQKKSVGQLAISYKEHFVQTYGALKYLHDKCTNFYQYSDIEVVKGKIKSKKSTLEFMTRTFSYSNTNRKTCLQRA